MVFSTLNEIRKETENCMNKSVGRVNSLIKFIEDIMRIIIDPLNVLRVILLKISTFFNFYKNIP